MYQYPCESLSFRLSIRFCFFHFHHLFILASRISVILMDLLDIQLVFIYISFISFFPCLLFLFVLFISIFFPFCFFILRLLFCSYAIFHSNCALYSVVIIWCLVVWCWGLACLSVFIIPTSFVPNSAPIPPILVGPSCKVWLFPRWSFVLHPLCYIWWRLFCRHLYRFLIHIFVVSLVFDPFLPNWLCFSGSWFL